MRIDNQTSTFLLPNIIVCDHKMVDHQRNIRASQHQEQNRYFALNIETGSHDHSPHIPRLPVRETIFFQRYRRRVEVHHINRWDDPPLLRLLFP